MVNHDRYESIKNVYKRDPDTHEIVMGEFSTPEFAYLRNCQWAFTEKIQGTNVQVILDGPAEFRSRSGKANLPKRLLSSLRDMFDAELILEQTEGLCLYGEGAGAGIEKGGRYGTEQFFTMFDAMTSCGWASQGDMLAIAERLHIPTVPRVFTGTIRGAVQIVRSGLKSQFGDFFAEGLVGRPTIELKNQWGERIIIKIKHKDFYDEKDYNVL